MEVEGFGFDLTKIDRHEVSKLSNESFRAVLEQVIDIQREDVKQNQILYYKPASERAERVHHSTAKVVGVSGGNGSSKTETCLVHMIALATGVFPETMRDILKEQFRGPINCRVVVESFTTTLTPIILPKLWWWRWTGVDEPGGERGHWGWIPKTSLVDGSWERSWSEKLKLLTVLCRDPDTGRVVGESQIQFNSKDQDPTDFASGDFHFILHDEPPLLAQWRENQARVMRVGGRIFLAFTWPDDPAIPVDWIYDEVYDRAQEPNKSPNHDWFELWTTENMNLNQDSIASQMEDWSDEMSRVRIYGGSMRFSNRIHPLFTDQSALWCFDCKKTAFLSNTGTCNDCGNTNIEHYNHVQGFDIQQNWPVVFLLDPHPRKPHMFMWGQIDPNDDIWVVADGQIDDDTPETVDYIKETEREMGLNVVARLIDPNMGRSPANATKRESTWQDEFETAGLFCDLADDSSTGRKTINEFLKPDRFTHRPRIHFHVRCTLAVPQMKRYIWADYKVQLEKDQMQKPREKYDDYPTLLKYLCNFNPSFSLLTQGAPVIKRGGKRRGAY